MIPRPQLKPTRFWDDGTEVFDDGMIEMATLHRSEIVNVNRKIFTRLLSDQYVGKKLTKIKLCDETIVLEFEGGAQLKASIEQETRDISFLVVNNTILWNLTFFREKT